jgi:hypothetical protein
MVVMCVRCVLIALALVATMPSLRAQGTLLGILEDVPGVYAGEPNSHAVRVVFERNGKGWRALPSVCPDEACLKALPSSYPREVMWTVTFDGRNLGRITAKTPKEFKFYSHVGLQDITSRDSVPIVGKRSPEYGGFTDQSVYRPLVTNAESYFKDPEVWKPAQSKAELIRVLRQKFHQSFSKLCKTSEHDETKLIPLAYRDEDIKIVKAYASKSGWSLARLHLEGATECDDVEAGSGMDDPWFVVDPERAVAYLDKGMWLVDVGDYDNDGNSELVFSISRYNRGGYELFYDHFKKKAKFEYSYH